MTGVEPEEPEWIEVQTVLVAHERSLADHGGPSGVRDEGLLESALQRPQNRFAYEGLTDLPALAATYMVGLAKNHPFIDGNKRTAFIVGVAFLRVNGVRLLASEADATAAMLAVAAGDLNVDGLAAWLGDNTAER